MRIVWRPRKRFADAPLLFGWSFVLAAAGGLAWVQLGGPSDSECLFKMGVGIPCVTCGTTRAASAFLQGRWLAAARHNPLAVSAIVLAAAMVPYLAVATAVKLPRLRIELTQSECYAAAAVVAVAFVAAWAFLIVDGR